MKSSAKNIKLTSYDDLFEPSNPTQSELAEKIIEIPLSELHSFKNHPFQVRDDETMADITQSICQYGVLVPAIARPRDEGGYKVNCPGGVREGALGYELIAGHRRRHGCELAGLTTMPVLVRNLSDDEATIIMVDSNIQRENLLPSEKAWAYKMKLDAIKHQGVKTASRQVGEKCSVDNLSDNANDSARNIHRYIRLTELLCDILQLVDDKKLALNTAVELSYLPQEEQQLLLVQMEQLAAIPSLAQAVKLKKYCQEGNLTEPVMESILTEENAKPFQVTLKKDNLQQYFPTSYTPKQMEQVIIDLLKNWHSKNTDAQ